MKIADIKVGDTVKVRGSGYLKNFVREAKIDRLTKNFMFAGNQKFSRLEGVLYPRDKYIMHYIFEVNGEAVE